jgi:hypothetical protein
MRQALIFALPIFVCCSIGRAQPFYGVNLNASMVVMTGTGPMAIETKFAINNANITKALFDSGTTTVAKASDLAVVEDAATLDIDVIDTTNSNIVMGIMADGTDSYTSQVYYPVKKGYKVSESLSDQLFTAPQISGTLTTDWNFTCTISLPSNTLYGLSVTFNGGNTILAGPSLTQDPIYVQGTIQQTSKVYP